VNQSRKQLDLLLPRLTQST